MPTFSRRQLLERTCLGFGNLVLADLLNGAATYNDLKPRRKHFPGQPLRQGSMSEYWLQWGRDQ